MSHGWKFCRLFNIDHPYSDDPDNDQEAYGKPHNCIRPWRNSAKGNGGEYDQEDYAPLDYLVGDLRVTGFHGEISMIWKHKKALIWPLNHAKGHEKKINC